MQNQKSFKEKITLSKILFFVFNTLIRVSTQTIKLFVLENQKFYLLFRSLSLFEKILVGYRPASWLNRVNYLYMNNFWVHFVNILIFFCWEGMLKAILIIQRIRFFFFSSFHFLCLWQKKVSTVFFKQDKQMQQKNLLLPFSRLYSQTQILPPLLSADTLRFLNCLSFCFRNNRTI